ncbi:esterase family protein [Pedobacter sp. SYP-B3415]|uniref:esterase family protein n=1 Tax=Pedobacter sp. SYP-B3415 TaxID=2496641 RepID=UPI00101D366E|nr:alpha/beta hydrolase-fold protein [Pedobacter sp. SYP-B3415]
MNEQHRKWYSPNLGAEIDLLIFGHAGIPVVLFPTSMGRYYESKDFGLTAAASWLINEGKVRIYCPDSVDANSFYNHSLPPEQRIIHHISYDRFVLNELVPLVQHETGFTKIVMAGCSFGGYHAANFTFRHPWLASHLFSMSGVFDIRDQLDGFYNDNVYFNNPMDFVPNDQNPELWNLRVVLGTSDRDICRWQNENFSKILSAKGIGHWLDVRPDADHDWPLWRAMFPDYLSQL